jgi:ubiquinone/menaquinone biosynthesis C-methylase UbiE
MTRLPARVLDLGCGDGFVTGTLARHSGVQITGLDPSATALERARAKHPDLQFVEPAEDGSLPFPDGSFDVVVCINVLQHVADTQRFMSEARRVLVPSGLIAITVPVHGRLAYLFRFERIHDPLEPTLRFYTRRSLAELLEQFGYGDVVFERGRWPFLRRTLCARARR